MSQMSSTRRPAVVLVLMSLVAASSQIQLDLPPAIPVKSPVQVESQAGSAESALGVLQASAEGIPIDTAAIEVKPR